MMNKKIPPSILETAHEINSVRSNTSSQESKRARQKNPFKIPDDQEYCVMIHDQKLKKDENRRALSDLQLYKKAPPISLSKFQSYITGRSGKSSTREGSIGSKQTLATDSNQIQENMRDFIHQKREIFLAQLAIDTKREELQRLDRIEHEEEENLKAKEGEINVFRDQFRTFLANDGKNTMEARQAAEIKAKQRIEVSMQIKQISSQISTLRNEIAHHEEKLKECTDYQTFLESLIPPKWRSQHPAPEMYFKDPKQLLDIMISLEEQNMFLIRHCQEAEEAVERYRTKFNNLLESRDGSITAMLDKKEKKKQELNEMNERNEQYKVTGEFRHGNELNPSEMAELQTAISKFHKQLGFENTASPDAPSMLRRIERKMEEVSTILSKMDEQRLKELTQEKELNRRNQERQQKNELEKKEQEEKTNRALALAMMPIKKRTGRPLLERMVPVKEQSREKKEEAARLKRLQELADSDLLYGPIWD